MVIQGCRPAPTYAPLTLADVGDIRSALGESHRVLEVSEHGETIHVILEFS